MLTLGDEFLHMNFDKTDADILKILQKDSSKSFVEIAKELGVTDGTIHQRIKKLKRSGAIKRFTVELDHEILGESSIAFILINIEPGYIESISKTISNFENTIEVYEIHTRGDVLVKIRASSPEGLRNIVIDKIRTLEGVVNTELIPVFKRWKEEKNLPIAISY
jgi:Lrp/AsnC family transcriptional regulator for asnA, asnC and gidA